MGDYKSVLYLRGDLQFRGSSEIACLPTLCLKLYVTRSLELHDDYHHYHSIYSLSLLLLLSSRLREKVRYFCQGSRKAATFSTHPCRRGSHR